jgi:transposase-like protein
MQFSMVQLAKIKSEGDAYKLIEDVRWGGTPECPHCGSTERISFLTPANGVSRKTRTGKVSERRLWFCGACRKQFTVLVGTIFHGTKVPLQVWLFVFYEMCANKNGIAAREIERRYEVTPKTAWFMTQRIREAMKRDPLAGSMSGVVVADEAWLGGSTANMPASKRKPTIEGVPHGEPRRIEPGELKTSQPRPPAGTKSIVLSLIEQSTGEVRSQVVPDVTGATLRKAIAEQVDMARTTLHTDESRSYMSFGHEFLAHETVNHSEDEYVRYDNGRVITSNAAEGYFSQLKRSIDGTHHHVSHKHLPRYLAEFDFRYSTRKMDDSARTARLFGQVGGRRLTYRPLTGR